MPNPPFIVGSDAVGDQAVDLAAVADRLSSLADTAELMGDDASAIRFRDGAAVMRLQAIGLLDG